MPNKEKTVNGKEEKLWRKTLRTLLNLILIGALIVFWVSVYSNGLPTGLGGGKFLVFFHVAIFLGIYKVNKN